MTTVPTPASATAGQPSTAAGFNTHRDALNLLLDPPKMAARKTAAQTIPSGVFTAITLQSELEDNDAMFTAGGSSFTVRTAGRWLVSYAVMWTANATGSRESSIFVNGAEADRLSTPANGGTRGTNLSTTTMIRFALNDVVELRGYQGSGGNLDVFGGTGADACKLSAQWIGK